LESTPPGPNGTKKSVVLRGFTIVSDGHGHLKFGSIVKGCVSRTAGCFACNNAHTLNLNYYNT